MMASVCRSIRTGITSVTSVEVSNQYSHTRSGPLKIKSHRMFLYMFKTITIYFKEFDFLPQVAHFKDFIPQAFPGGQSMILDAEVLLIDTKTSKPLPFGSLGVHKVTRN